MLFLAANLLPTWPRDYHDIYFGQDNCLYDSGSITVLMANAALPKP
jgi:hypothetical protein